ncbi:amidohydrolase family protein [Hyalangium rubrum]|uniref:Amidohydrolase family protein n=1 Tax=Hyalangium rubrum TaxID=3103134 RepID=A0ABU5HGI6_9BACT|nr:amidohydrolase family protein [Hyalangium sp. s54d21]MDY7232351.1 amidohydrolase family protein [Hyalangium sp. s54d21]
MKAHSGRAPRAWWLGLLMALMGCATAQSAESGAAPASATSGEPVTAFVGVSVLPLDSDTVLVDQTVVVRGERIEAIGPTPSTPVPAGATRIDGAGRYLMPGLVDMHLHLMPGEGAPSDPAVQQLSLLLANGITTARALVAPPTALALRERVARREVLGPLLRVAGPSFHGKSVQGPEQARQKVREQKAAGYDLIKTHGGLGRETYDAMVAEAKAQGLRVSGHVTPDVGLARALEAGQQIEHLDGYLAALLPPGDKAEVGQVELGDVLSRMDLARLPAIAEATKRAGIFNSPTLALFEVVASEGAVPELRTQRELRYVPSAAVDAWTKELLTGPLSQAPAANKQKFLELRRQVLRGLHAAGVPLLVGSDSPQLFMVSGFALHREMEAQVAAGLPPLAVLQAATRNAAAYFGESSQWGAVAPGQRADLLLLNGNPLKDIQLARAIAGVMARGQWLPKSELDAKLEEAATAAKATKAAGK